MTVVVAMCTNFMSRLATILPHRQAQADLDRILDELPRHIEAPLKSSLPSDWKLLLLQRVEPVTILGDNRLVFGADVTQAAIALGFVQPTR